MFTLKIEPCLSGWVTRCRLPWVDQGPDLLADLGAPLGALLMGLSAL